MENRAYAIAVGIFTLVLGVGLALAYWWMTGSQQARTEYVISSKLPVSGLNQESTVKFRGVDVGKVTEISLDPASQTTILIGISVAENLKLSTEAYAELRRQGLTGLAYLDLNDESKNAPPLQAGGIIPLRPTLVDDLISKGAEFSAQFELLMRNTNQLTESANRVLNNLDVQKLNNTIENFEKLSRKALPAVDSATSMFNSGNRLMSDKNQAQIMQTLESAQQTFSATEPLINELTLTTKKFHSTANQIETSTNQLTNKLNTETLPQLEILTQNMNQSTLHFNQLIDTLQENPQSIIFGTPAPPPGPGEDGFTQP